MLGRPAANAVPPASILLFLLLFFASQGLWLLSGSTGHCSLQEKLAVSKAEQNIAI